MKSRKRKSMKKGKGPIELSEAIKKIQTTYKKVRPELRKRRNIKIYETLSESFTNLPEDLQRLVTEQVSTIRTLQNENTPFLLKAAKKGYLRKIKHALDNYADIEATNKDGYTPLQMACLNSNIAVVKLLLKRGANINVNDDEEKTPLHYACMKGGNLVITQLLLDAGADINIKDKNGFTPLHLACKVSIFNKLDVVRLLIQRGANVNSKSRYGTTPLHLACIWGNITLVGILLKAGANINAKDSGRRTPKMIASEFSNTEIVRLLDNYTPPTSASGKKKTAKKTRRH